MIEKSDSKWLSTATAPSRWQIRKACNTLTHGGVIAYPTETIYGLGCDPLNRAAVEQLLIIKKRSWRKGLILVAATVKQVEAYINPLTAEQMTVISQTWPGPVTWIFNAQQHVPRWLTGKHKTIALRVSPHPTVQALCRRFGGAIVSTSANRSKQPPKRTALLVRRDLGNDIDYIRGEVSLHRKPSEIRNATSGKIIRSN